MRFILTSIICLVVSALFAVMSVTTAMANTRGPTAQFSAIGLDDNTRAYGVNDLAATLDMASSPNGVKTNSLATTFSTFGENKINDYSASNIVPMVATIELTSASNSPPLSTASTGVSCISNTDIAIKNSYNYDSVVAVEQTTPTTPPATPAALGIMC